MGKSSSSTTKYTYMPGQKSAYQSLLGSTMGQVDYGKMLQPYTGQYTVPYSTGEKWGQDYMKNLLTSDPSQSSLYRGLRNQAYENQDRALTGVRQSAALGGMLASTPRIGQEAQVQRQTPNENPVWRLFMSLVTFNTPEFKRLAKQFIPYRAAYRRGKRIMQEGLEGVLKIGKPEKPKMKL